ncbi:MAG: hypothetical protein V4694_06320 [Pseudomonadota bacterium]
MRLLLSVKSLLILLLMTSCVSGLNVNQERKLTAIQQEHSELYQEEKNVGSAAAFGLLPGGGSFYTRNYVVGVVDLLVWPISILWDPINGVNGAKEINFYSTLAAVKRAKNKELASLKVEYVKDTITEKEYNIRKMEIEDKYDVEKNL